MVYEIYEVQMEKCQRHADTVKNVIIDDLKQYKHEIMSSNEFVVMGELTIFISDYCLQFYDRPYIRHQFDTERDMNKFIDLFVKYVFFPLFKILDDGKEYIH